MLIEQYREQIAATFEDADNLRSTEDEPRSALNAANGDVGDAPGGEEVYYLQIELCFHLILLLV